MVSRWEIDSLSRGGGGGNFGENSKFQIVGNLSGKGRIIFRNEDRPKEISNNGNLEFSKI